MHDKEQYQRNWQSQLTTWRQSLAAMNAQADKVSAQYELEFHRQLDLLQAKLELAALKLQQLHDATGVEWEELKASLDGIRNEIENALDSAWAKIG